LEFREEEVKILIMQKIILKRLKHKVMAGVFKKVEIIAGKVVRTELGPLASSLLSEIYPQENMLERIKREYEDAHYELVRLKQEIVSPKRWLVKAVHGFLSLGKEIPDIAGILDLSIEETYNLAQQIPHK
jgi:hypothetical protein